MANLNGASFDMALPKYKPHTLVEYKGEVSEVESIYPDRGGWYYFLKNGQGPLAELEIKSATKKGNK